VEVGVRESRVGTGAAVPALRCVCLCVCLYICDEEWKRVWSNFNQFFCYSEIFYSGEREVEGCPSTGEWAVIHSGQVQLNLTYSQTSLLKDSEKQHDSQQQLS